MATKWGRNERLVWAPHMPVYSYMALGATFLCVFLFFWESYAFQHPESRRHTQ